MLPGNFTITPKAVAGITLIVASMMLNTAVNAHEKEEIRFLMNQIDRLEQRVLSLEQGTPASAPSSSAEPSSYAWDSLAEGMTQQQVLDALGRPGKVHESAGKTTWFYPDLLGGSVHFANARVTGWQKP